MTSPSDELARVAMTSSVAFELLQAGSFGIVRQLASSCANN
jgi:hypothetical protein